MRCPVWENLAPSLNRCTFGLSGLLWLRARRGEGPTAKAVWALSLSQNDMDPALQRDDWVPSSLHALQRPFQHPEPPPGPGEMLLLGPC